MNNENKPYYQTIYIFGDEENLEKLKNFISNINDDHYIQLKERNENNIITIASIKENVKYNIFFENSYIQIGSVMPYDGFFDKYKDFPGELYNRLLIIFFDSVLKNYIIKNLNAGVHCEITDPNFNLLYLDPEHWTNFR